MVRYFGSIVFPRPDSGLLREVSLQQLGKLQYSLQYQLQYLFAEIDTAEFEGEYDFDTAEGPDFVYIPV